jgi:hypothetical protein
LAKSKHNWKRFWIPSGKTPPLNDHGFLHDPESEYAHFYYSGYRARSLDQLTETPVAILLGEPGIGKSTTLTQEFLRLQTEGKACLYRELNQYYSDNTLISDIFNSEELQAWRKGDHRLTVLLDSLDECHLIIPNVARILVRHLKDLPKHRLSLRLTCRTTDWPAHIADELSALWLSKDNGTEQVAVFELAPLREIDVLCAAADRGLDPEGFVREVQENNIQALASHPNTLNMLLGRFGSPGGLPKQRSELYRLGCETLADEHNAYRKKESKLNRKLTARQRMAVAGRIAAQMVFSHRTTIWEGDAWEVETSDLLERDIIGETEHMDGLDFDIDSHSFQETIGCSLFSGRGANRIGFAHQSYKEFLAAWYLHFRGLDARRTLTLLLHPEDRRIPPQHIETATWIAALDGDVLNALTEREPLLLLRADLSNITGEQKIQLAQTLLIAFATEIEFDRDGELSQHYHKLTHPELPELLRPYIVNESECRNARNAAIKIAAACEIKEFADDLVCLVLNQHEAHNIRVSAANALTIVANDVQFGMLRELALGEAIDDTHDTLRSIVIPSLWPSPISTKEIFTILQHHGVGCLGKLLYLPNIFVERFTAGDLVIALQWIADSKNDIDFRTIRFKDAIMAKAWDELGNSHVRTAFAETAWACLERHERIFDRVGNAEKDLLEKDDQKRRIAITELLNICSTKGGDPWTLIVGEIFLSKDAIWLLELYRSAVSTDLRISLTKCIDHFLRYDANPEWLDAVISTAAEDDNSGSPLSDLVSEFIGPIYLGSEKAEKLKEQYAQQLKLKKRALLDPPPSVRVTEALGEFEGGKNDSWYRLWQELSLPDGAVRYKFSFDAITESPGWQRTTPPEQASIVKCGERWLKDQCLSPEEIFAANNSVSYRYIATYLALQLLFDKASQSLEAVDSDTWSQWAVWLVAYPYDNKIEQRKRLIKLAYERAPTAVLKTFERLIERNLKSSIASPALGELSAIWDNNVSALVHGFLVKPDLNVEQIGALLELLLEQGDEEAFEFACHLLNMVGNESLQIVTATALATYQASRSWSLIWKMVCYNASFGEQLLLGLACSSRRSGEVLFRLSEMEIAELYCWLEEHFPAETDNHYPEDEAHSVTARDEVGYLRDHCPSYLSGLGTRAAIDALQFIYDRFPDRDWLKYLVNEAKKSFRKATLQALSPPQLITYTHRREARLARSSIELMDAVLTSLRRFQEKLHGQTPLAPFLWDLVDNGTSGRPKHEDRLTDFVKFFLERDLPTFVIDREVQIRNLKEHGMGERTDLKIEAKDQDGRSLSVIIENKGCWHKELLTAMQTQLIGRYLKLAPEACGIYLVGWFHCDRWRGKKSCVFKGAKEELLTHFNKELSSPLYNDGRVSIFVYDATY